MVDTQHFCLRWNNYQSSITSAFENLRDDEDFVDVTLACDGRSLKAHRVVLSACSPYFRELLKSTPCKHPVIVLQDVAFTDLHALVEFIYHGEVNVHQRSLSSFLKTAEVLRVSGLTQQQAEETHNLAQVQSLANSERSGGRTPAGHHQSFADKLVEDALFPQSHAGASPPPNMSSPHSGVNQLLRRAAVAAAIRRERISSSQSDELSSKRHRSSGDGGAMGNNNNPDVLNHMPQITATDFSTIKHNNNLSPHIKDSDRHMLNKTPIGINNNIISNNNNTINTNNKDSNNTNATTTNGGGSLGSSTDKESLTPSPPARSNDDVKCEPMELVCPTNDQEHSNDSMDEPDHHQHVNMSGNGNEGKGQLRIKNFSLPHDDDLENSIHSHTAPPFMMPPDGKLFSSPGSFNFSMAALAADSAALAGFNSQALAQAAEMAGSPQGAQSAVVSASSSSSSHMPPLRMPPPTSGGINEPQECPYCRRTFSCYYSLKRHFQDKHEQSDTLYVCEFCHRRYRTKNSLTTHKSLQHRGSSGMLKRLLKTSAIKNVLSGAGAGIGAVVNNGTGGQQQQQQQQQMHHHQQRSHLFDFAAELGQPPPGIP